MIDLDNTLGDRSAAVGRWVDEFCEARSLGPAERDWLLAADNDGYSSRQDVFEATKERFGLKEPVPDLVHAYRSRVIELTTPMQGARQCLASLRAAGHHIAVVTNGSSGQQHGKIDALGFRELVNAVIVSGDLGFKKPDRRIFEAVATATGVPLTGGWMVGDSISNDVVGPQELGLKTAWLHRGRAWPADSETPTAIIDHVGQFPDLLV